MKTLADQIALVERQRDTINTATDGLSAVQNYAEWCIRRKAAIETARTALTRAGAAIRDSGPDASFRLAGIRSTSTGGLGGALSNWLNRARAKLAQEAGA